MSDFFIAIAAFLGAIILFWSLAAHIRHGAVAAVFLATLLVLEPVGTMIMAVVSLAVYLGCRSHRIADRRWMIALLVLSSAYLVYDKYLPALVAVAVGAASFEQALVPLGLSYLTFRLLHYVIEMSNGRIPQHSLSDFGFYAFFLPIYTAGPIERFDHFLANRKDRLDSDDIRYAILRLILGMIKAFALPGLMLAVMNVTTPEQIHARLFERTDVLIWWQIWAACYFLMVYYYLNIAGYADLAVGSSILFGQRIVENFNMPLIATNLPDFWRRWHISLGDWCRTYIFFPVSRITRSAALAALVAFLAIGAWHSAHVAWLLWGLYHGIGVILATWIGRQARWAGLPLWVRQGAGWCATSLYTSFGLVITVGIFSYGFAAAFGAIAAAFGMT